MWYDIVNPNFVNASTMASATLTATLTVATSNPAMKVPLYAED